MVLVLLQNRKYSAKCAAGTAFIRGYEQPLSSAVRLLSFCKSMLHPDKRTEFLADHFNRET